MVCFFQEIFEKVQNRAVFLFTGNYNYETVTDDCRS